MDLEIYSHKIASTDDLGEDDLRKSGIDRIGSGQELLIYNSFFFNHVIITIIIITNRKAQNDDINLFVFFVNFF